MDVPVGKSRRKETVLLKGECLDPARHSGTQEQDQTPLPSDGGKIFQSKKEAGTHFFFRTQKS